MNGAPQRSWVTLLLRRSGLYARVERYHRDQGQEHETPNRRRILHRARSSFAYPALVAALAVISAGTGFYPYGPVLATAVVVAPERWRAIYLAACIGAATGAMVLAHAVQTLGVGLITQYFPGLEQSDQWLRAEQWIAAYGSLALAVIAALPLPEIPPLLLTALAKTPLPLIGAAIFAGKLCKYGAYIFAVRLILRMIRLGLEKAR